MGVLKTKAQHGLLESVHGDSLTVTSILYVFGRDAPNGWETGDVNPVICVFTIPAADSDTV